MKHDEIYNKHADRKAKPPRRKFTENKDRDARLRRLSFKNYVRELEEDLLEVDLGFDDTPVV